MPNWSQSSLLLVAHGSSRYPDAAADLLRLAEMIRARRLFERVDVAFWRQEPMLSPAQLQGGNIYVLPFFAGLGKHTEQLIPERLGLRGKVTESDERRITYCPPLGCHGRVPDLIAERAGQLCRHHGLDRAQTALLLIGHGSQEGNAGRTPEAIAASLRRRNEFAEIVTLYLEQTPHAREWRTRVTAPAVIAQPLLLSAGMHASDDLPPLFGMTDGKDSPRQLRDHRVWLQNGIGSDDEIIAMMLEQIEAAA
jgi:sirohydrochlorin cobaltochelatase